MHRTYRWLDAPPKLLGFTFGQWVMLITALAAGYGCVRLLHVPPKVAVSTGVFAIGLPAALAYLSEGGRLHLGTLLRDAVRWVFTPDAFPAGAAQAAGALPTIRLPEVFPAPDGRGARGRRARLAAGTGLVGRVRRSPPSAGDLLPLVAVGEDGLAICRDGAYLRYLEVSSPVNPLVQDEQTLERLSEAFGSVAARLDSGRCLQLYVQAEPLAVEDLLAREAHAVEIAAGAAESDGEPALARAMRRLGRAAEQSIRTHSQATCALSLRYLVVVPWRPQRIRARRGELNLDVAVHERAMRDSLRQAEGVRGDLEAMKLNTRFLDGREVIDLLWSRFDPEAASTVEPSASWMHPGALGLPVPGEAPSAAVERSRVLREAICGAPLDFSARGHLCLGDCLEQVSYLASVPEYTWVGWLMHAMQVPRPFALSVHIEATDRYRERQAQKRRWKRLRGVNLGVERQGRPVDPETQEQEREAEELNHDLATSAGAGVYRMSFYFATREPGPNPDQDTLHELAQATSREITLVTDAQVQAGWFAQRQLWESSLPLGADVARRTRKYLTRNVGDSFPLVGASCGSPGGIPFGYSQPGRTLERLDPFDEQHENHMLIVNGKSGTGKTMSVIILLVRALCKGLRAAIIDRAGHFEFLAGLIPGAIQVTLGGRGNHEAVCPWDVPDPSRVEQSKVDYLLALHALLLGRHHSEDYGLGDLEENLLGLAIREVYARCALTGEPPRELLLQEEALRHEESEARAGASDIAATLRNLALRLNNYIGEGPYAYLTDWPTTVAENSRLVIFDTRAIPDARAAAALFVICEYVTTRIERDRATYLDGDGPHHEWAGRFALVIDEAWKLLNPSTGPWFEELSRRSRHLALWLIGISQQLSDFDNPHGRALLKNAAMRQFLGQDAEELAYMRETLDLTGEQVAAISSLQTSKRQYANTFLMNGTRGSGTISIRVADLEYWIATSEPVRDEPLRRRALRDADGDGWMAIRLLANPQWHLERQEESEAA